MPEFRQQLETTQKQAEWYNKNVPENGTEKKWQNHPYQNAQIIYEWFIKPIQDLLGEQIDTLVIVPHGVLRTIPFAALHDGRQFLIEKKYALAVTPGIKLTNSAKAMPRDNVPALLSGTAKFQHDIPLENIPVELNKTACVLRGDEDALQNEDIAFSPKWEKNCVLEGKIDILQNENFTFSNIARMLDNIPYSVVHFTTHGRFEHEQDDSYLLTYDGKIKVDDLETLIRVTAKKFQYQPIRLLTLSACETALGDDRAALGLAGVAIKAGVPSALATLWRVNPAASEALIIEFYRQWKQDTKLY